MSKSYFMVQIVYPPQTMPNAELEEISAAEADKYIKAGKMTKRGVMDHIRVDSDLYSVPPTDDYRKPICNNRIALTFNEDGTAATWGFNPTENQVFYRILMDAESAESFREFCLQYGALAARIITEADRGVVDGVPSTLFDFPEDAHVQQYLWTE